VLVFKERGKPEHPEKNLTEQGREPTTNSTHIWRRRQDSNPGHIGGRRVLSPLRHPCSPRVDGGTPHNGLYGEAPPERGTFFRFQEYERCGFNMLKYMKG